MIKSQTNNHEGRNSLFIFRKTEDSDSIQGHRDSWALTSKINGNTQIIEQLGIIDLTQKVYENHLERSVGMGQEVRKVFTILSKRYSNTPLIFGKNGVGKSTIPKRMAHKIVNGRVISQFHSCRLLSLNLALLTAGAGVRGEVAQRLKNYFTMLDKNPHVITIVDECQLLAARDFMESEIIHFLKVNLNNGKYQFVLITDLAGVSLITEDPAMMGRVSPIEIPVPGKRSVIRIIQGAVLPELEQHYKMKVHKDLIEIAYKLSEEVLPYDREQPARCIKLIDTSMANENYVKNLRKLSGSNSSILHEEILEATAKEFIQSSHTSLSQNERLLRLDTLAETLKKQIIGQDNIIDAIVRDLQLKYHQKPSRIGMYFLYGDSGTGKTELATQIGIQLSGDQFWVRIDCSQLIDRWSVTTLLGSYPGLIYSDRSSMLSRIRFNPYTTFIFDELEKAHPEVIMLFLQILQPPHIIRDNRGVKLDFSKSLIFFTSNVAHTDQDKQNFGFKNSNDKAVQKDGLQLTAYFPNEFLGRLHNKIYRFHPMNNMKDLLLILDLEIAKLAKRWGIELLITEKAKESLIDSSLCKRFGVRGIQSELSRVIEPQLCSILKKRFEYMKYKDENNKPQIIKIIKKGNQIKLMLEK